MTRESERRIAPPLPPLKPLWSDPLAATHSDVQDTAVDRVGIVFVHGVGFQTPGDTLRSWSLQIIRMLRERRVNGSAYGGQDPVTVATGTGVLGADLPYVEARIPAVGDHRAQHWMMTEAFWADAIHPPSLGTVVSWLRENGVARAADDMASPNDPRITKRVGGARRAANQASRGLLVSVFSSLFLLAYVAVRGLASLLPLEILRSSVLAPMERFLTSWAGDMRTLLFDEVQSATVRGTVATAIKAVREYGCDDVILVAHSGGAVASYMTLTDPLFRNLRVSKLITFGQGLNIARRLLKASTTTARGGTVASVHSRFFDRFDGRVVLWHDFYATEDPVPNGPVVSPAGSPRPELESVAVGEPTVGRSVSNRWSARDDHGGYWENDEEFVVPLMQHLDTPRGRPTASRFGRATDVQGASREGGVDAVTRRRQRVSALAIWRQLCFSSAAASLFLGVVVGQWAHWSGDPEGGAGVLRDMYAPLVGIWHSMEWTSWLAVPVEALRTNPWWPLVLLGYFLWPAAAAIALVSVAPQFRRWREPWRGGMTVVVTALSALPWLVVAVGVLVVIPALLASGLASTPVWATVDRVWDPAFSYVASTQFPTPVVAFLAQFLFALALALITYAIAWVAIRLWRLARRWQATHLFAAGAVVIAGLVALLSAVYALVADQGYGWFILAFVLATIPFALLNVLARWRWRAWDQQERWEYRTGGRRRYGRAFDAVVWLWLGVALVGLVMWIGFSTYAVRLSLLGGAIAFIFALLVVVFGTVLDAMNALDSELEARPEVQEDAFTGPDTGGATEATS